ncbi:hypothetical protein SDJN02_21481, partial [Cucurbita argyrosperma subsp. argyrosperma]
MEHVSESGSESMDYIMRTKQRKITSHAKFQTAVLKRFNRGEEDNNKSLGTVTYDMLNDRFSGMFCQNVKFCGS